MVLRSPRDALWQILCEGQRLPWCSFAPFLAMNSFKDLKQTLPPQRYPLAPWETRSQLCGRERGDPRPGAGAPGSVSGDTASEKQQTHNHTQPGELVYASCTAPPAGPGHVTRPAPRSLAWLLPPRRPFFLPPSESQDLSAAPFRNPSARPRPPASQTLLGSFSIG